MPFFRRGNSLGLATEEKHDEKKDEPLPFVTPDQLNSFGSSLKTELSGIINGVAAEMRGVFQGVQMGQGQGQRTQPNDPPPIDDLSDDEYREALSTGDAERLRIRERANAERLRRESQIEIPRARSEVPPVLESMSTELASSILSS